MAIRLSKRGWNNVLIFASMFMIVLFNYTHKMFSEGSNVGGDVSSLLPASTLVQTIDFNGIKFERLGTGWRTLTELKDVQIESPKRFLDVWLQQPFVITSGPPQLSTEVQSSIVVVWVAGQSNGWVYEFLIEHRQQQAYAKAHADGTWYSIPYHQINQLIPEVLLRN